MLSLGQSLVVRKHGQTVEEMAMGLLPLQHNREAQTSERKGHYCDLGRQLSRFSLGSTDNKFNLEHIVQALYGCSLTWVWRQMQSEKTGTDCFQIFEDVLVIVFRSPSKVKDNIFWESGNGQFA